MKRLLIAALSAVVLGTSVWAGTGSELVENGTFDTSISGWTTLYGVPVYLGDGSAGVWLAGTTGDDSLVANSGEYYQADESGDLELGVSYQTINLASRSGLSQTLINAGLYRAVWGADLKTYTGDTDAARYRIYDNTSTEWYDSGYQVNTAFESFGNASYSIAPGTTSATIELIGERDSGTDNDGQIDNVTLKMYEQEKDISTSGKISGNGGIWADVSYTTTYDLTVGSSSTSEYGGFYVKDGADCTLGDLTIDSYGTVYLRDSDSTLTVGTLTTGGTFLWEDGRLEAISVAGSLDVNGTFAPGNSPADSSVSGDLTLGSGDVLEMELGGYVLGDEYDRLTVMGVADISGSTLDVVYIDGFSDPQNGQVFDLFNWSGGVSGTFGAVNLPTLADGLEWDTSDLYDGGTLGVIPEPAVVTLIAFAGIGGLFVRRLFPGFRI